MQPILTMFMARDQRATRFVLLSRARGILEDSAEKASKASAESLRCFSVALRGAGYTRHSHMRRFCRPRSPHRLSKTMHHTRVFLQMQNNEKIFRTLFRKNGESCTLCRLPSPGSPYPKRIRQPKFTQTSRCFISTKIRISR
jgi:hypothetical protein